MRKLVKGWLSCWTYVITAVAGVLIGLTAANWTEWNLQTKLMALSTALLALHVLEEWYFPGGFHYIYNLMTKSETPDRYPMNQLTDMLTNLIGILFGCVALIVGVNPVLALMQFILCCGEVICHTLSGFFIRKMFKAKGKRTIYNPGLFTSLFGYFPIAVCFVYSFINEQTPSLRQIVLAVVFGALLIGFAVQGVEMIFKRKDTPYPYTRGNGYFEKFMK
ncbi:MAG: HXXEE domain-containing protein [Acutalibacteraceae bacterium]